jgi:ADP-dependent NAD(P)H-hydrate dehydratase / NAD(P)H-hydrate epimerase
MKIFSAEKIRAIDAATISGEPVSSADLMERAANSVSRWISEKISSVCEFMIFAGPGNNGGDALAVARMLLKKGYAVNTFIIETGSSFSEDMKHNKARLDAIDAPPFLISSVSDIPEIRPEFIVLDGIFGCGLSRPPAGLAAEAIKRINESGAKVISIDIPSGLYCESSEEYIKGEIIRASFTLSFQFPKLSFMFEDNFGFTGDWEILDIGLLNEAVDNESTPYNYIDQHSVLPLLKTRHKFDHKGTWGHVLIAAGSYGKTGAAILASASALRTGAGLVTCLLPTKCVTAFQCAIPEAMVIPDKGEEHISSLVDLSKYDSIGVGPGLGTDQETRKALGGILASFSKPMVIDADALNILALEPELMSLIPENSILTPHPGEFSRLTGGEKCTGLKRLRHQIEFAKRYKCIVVLKGACTSVATPDGNVWFNSTGNPGMATAGSGDVLTGMIASLLAQNYLPVNAAIIGTYIHGLAGDIALEENSHESLIAGDIIKNTGLAFRRVSHWSY